ncbi:hypothetical protein N7522_003629, partial [Penicillium canescens]
ALYRKLQELAARPAVPAYLGDHTNELSIELPRVSHSNMSVYDTNHSFGLKDIDGYAMWQFPQVQICLSHDFFSNGNGCAHPENSPFALGTKPFSNRTLGSYHILRGATSLYRQGRL